MAKFVALRYWLPTNNYAGYSAFSILTYQVVSTVGLEGVLATLRGKCINASDIEISEPFDFGKV
jgi:uncharacterized membrane protein